MSLYYEQLNNEPIKFQKIRKGDLSSYHLNLILIEMDKLRLNKLQTYNYFLKKKIRLQIHYIPVYKHTYYKKNFNQKDFPNNERYYQNTFSFPLYYDLKKQDVKYISDHIKNFIDKYHI